MTSYLRVKAWRGFTYSVPLTVMGARSPILCICPAHPKAGSAKPPILAVPVDLPCTRPNDEVGQGGVLRAMARALSVARQ